MIAFTLLVSGMLVCIRMIPGNLHPFQLAFFRNLFGLLLLMGWQSKKGLKFLKTPYLKLHLIRGVFNVLAMLAYFYAVFITPIASIAALTFTSPLFASLLAIFFLKEPPRFERLFTIAVGVTGAFVILRPSSESIHLGPLLILLSAMSWAVVLLVIKKLSKNDSSLTIATYMVIFTTPFTFLAALPFWQWPDLSQLIWLLLMSTFGTVGQISLAQSFKLAEASAVLPLDFLQLVWGALMGFLLFGEVPDRWVWIGGFTIFLSATYLALKESRSPETSVASP